MKYYKILFKIVFIVPIILFGNNYKKSDYKHSIGSSVFLLGNLEEKDSPNYFQLNYGYEVNKRNIFFIEAISWTYYEPLGTYGDSKKRYPGKIKSYGIGIGYQHFFWKDLYTSIQVTPFFQKFFDKNNKKIEDGFQLNIQSRLGYRYSFFDKNRCFIEPSIAFNYWPINTNFPDDFKKIEKDAPNYRFEPGLHFGFKF